MFDLFNQEAFNQMLWCAGIALLLQTVATHLIFRYAPSYQAIIAAAFLIGMFVFVALMVGTASGEIGTFIGAVIGLFVEEFASMLITLTVRLARSRSPGIKLGMAPTYVDEFDRGVSRPGDKSGCGRTNFADQEDHPDYLSGYQG